MKNMIRVALLIALMTLSLLPAKADSPRMVVIEEGTNASCGPCASQNPIFQTYLNNNKDIVIPLKIQASFPGRDIMNAADPAMHNGRISYYGIQGVPTAIFNGAKLPKSSNNFYDGSPADTMAFVQAVEEIRGTMSPITLTIEETRNGDTMNVKVTVASSQDLTGSNKLRVAIVEYYRFYGNAGTNGENEFHNIMRKMLPSINGEALNISAGESKSFEYSYKIQTTGQYALDPSMLHVVAFVQDDDTKEILQGATNTKEEAAFVGVSLDSWKNVVPRQGSVTQSVNIVNTSDNEVSVNVEIDNEANPLPTGWSATVTPATITIPAGGTSSVDVEVKSPASAGFQFVGLKAATKFEDKFNIPSRNIFTVLSENPKIVTFTGFSSFAASNYSNAMTPALKNDAIVFPYNQALLDAFSAEFESVEAMIFPLNTLPIKLPDNYTTYPNPLNTIEVALNTNKKVMIVASSAMQWAYDAFEDNADGQLQEVQDFFNAIGLNYEKTKVRYSGNSLFQFSVRGVSGDVIGNRLNNGGLINCNQQSNISNRSYNLYNDVFSISNPAIAKPVLYYDNIQSELAAARIELDGNRMVYSTFGLEAIGTANAAAGNEFFKRCIDWLMTGTAASAEDIAEGSNEELSLAINPNPMSDMAVVNYTVNGQTEKFVTITVVDAMGREVASLYSGMTQPGSHALSFNAAQLPAGAYRMITRTMGGSGVQLPLMINR